MSNLEELKAEIRTLETQREELDARIEQTEETILWLPGYSAAMRAHELELDELLGELDEVSNRLGHAENDLWELEGRIGRAEFVADVAYGRNL